MSWRPWWPSTSAGSVALEEVDGGDTKADAAERLLRRMIGDEKWDSLPSRTRDERRAEGEALLTELDSTRGGAPYDTEQITVPVICARGTTSDEHLRRGPDELVSELADAELAVIDGAGHGAHQSHPAELAQLIRRVVRRAQDSVGR